MDSNMIKHDESTSQLVSRISSTNSTSSLHGSTFLGGTPPRLISSQQVLVGLLSRVPCWTATWQKNCRICYRSWSPRFEFDNKIVVDEIRQTRCVRFFSQKKRVIYILYIFTIPFILNLLCQIKDDTVDGIWVYYYVWENLEKRCIDMDDIPYVYRFFIWKVGDPASGA